LEALGGKSATANGNTPLSSQPDLYKKTKKALFGNCKKFK